MASQKEIFEKVDFEKRSSDNKKHAKLPSRQILLKILIPGMRFPTIWHFDKCRLRRACAASFKLNCHRIFKGLAKALIRLRICAGWSEPLLVTHATLWEISFHGPLIKYWNNFVRVCFLQVVESNPDPESTLLQYLRTKCILTCDVPYLLYKFLYTLMNMKWLFYARNILSYNLMTWNPQQG